MPLGRATVLDSFVGQGGASFRPRSLARESWACRPETWAGATNRVARKTTRRTTGGRLHQVCHANTRKAFETSGKEGRLRTLVSILGGHARHWEEPRCWIRSWGRAALLLGRGVWRANPGRADPSRGQGPPTESPAKRRAGPQGVDCTRSTTPTRRGNQRQTGQTLHFGLHFPKPCSPFWIAPVLDSFVAQAGASFRSRHSGARIPTVWAQTRVVGKLHPTESPPAKRRAGPQAVDCTRSRTPTRRGKPSKPAAKGADSAPCTSVCEVTLAILKRHGAGFALLTSRRRPFVADTRVRLWAQTRVARRQVAADSTRRSKPGRLHPIRGASEQKKAVNTKSKVGRKRTLEATFAVLPVVEKRHRWRVCPPHREARRFVRRLS